MKFYDLPLEKQRYAIQMSNKSVHVISGTSKHSIVNSKAQFFEIEDGSVINRSFIVEIVPSIKETKIKLLELPDTTLKILEKL